MPSYGIDAATDPIHPERADPVSITVDGTAYHGVAGQTIAAVLLASGRRSWRRTSSTGVPRGLFCGIGVCFDCIAIVNDMRDVRLCQRRAAEGDCVQTQHDALPVRRSGEAHA